MSQENVEVVRRAWEAVSRGDLDALLATFDPEVVWDTTNFKGWPEAEVYHGHDGVRRILEEWLASWERYEGGADELFDVGDDRVLVRCWQRGVGPGSHAPVEMQWAQIITLENGLAVRIEAYSDWLAAREAVELAE